MKKYHFIIYLFVLMLLVLGVGKIMQHLSERPRTNLPEIPASYSNMENHDNKEIVITDSSGQEYVMRYQKPRYTLGQFVNDIRGTRDGVEFNFQDSDLDGKLYYGFIDRSETPTSVPVYFKEVSTINSGNASINIADNLSGKYDMVGWQESARSEMGYRVVDNKGNILYDGRVHISGKGPFQVAKGIIEGPFLNKVTHEQAVISFKTNKPLNARLAVDGRILQSEKKQTRHEILVDDLQAESKYKYHILAADYKFSSSFHTAPKPGSRSAFTFGFTSDSRAGQGAGERNVHGVNMYMMKRMASYASGKKLDFWQFTGDMIDGYLQTTQETKLQYAGWKRAVEPFAHHVPVFVGMGNHEALSMKFSKQKDETEIFVDRFPFEEQSAEAVFASEFVNFENGPQSEYLSNYSDSVREKKPGAFPSYKENVFSYTWDNVGMIVLNSDYWYAVQHEMIPISSGNPHGYIMDAQLDWFEKEIMQMENDSTIRHVFVTLHTPPFPNGGHADDDMWYAGNNSIRPYVNGEPVDKGIIERRDQLLDLMINQSSKTRAVLCGDEHNYSRLAINDSMPRYPENYKGEKLKLTRSFTQLTNGSAGAPYYSKEELPWSDFVKLFSTQNAMILFHVHGEDIHVEVKNPNTFELVEQFDLH